jgi:hypothetical protein
MCPQTTPGLRQGGGVFFRALEGTEVILDSCDLETFVELGKSVDEFRPQIVHLVGQGVVKDGKNYF